MSKQSLIGWFCKASSIVVAMVLMNALVFAQADLGTISGVVRDATGAVVADAKVVVTQTSTNTERTTTSSDIGEFRVQNLNPGDYSVVISKTGFQTYKAAIEVAVGGHSTLDAALRVGSGDMLVEVIAGTAGTEVNTQTQELSQLIDSQQLAQLPSLTRNPYDFVAISGNVSNGDTTSNGGMTAAGAGGQEISGRGVGYSINGQRESGTEILLDGVENVAIFNAFVGEYVPLDAVQEYSVVTNNISAEYGRAAGGVVNVTTKPGSNNWHGSAWEFNRLSAYTANTFNNVANGLPKGKYTRNQFGFQVGGPLIKNKLFASESTEFTRVRSNSVQTEEIFDPSFISLLPANAQAYFAQYGSTSLTATPVTTAGQLTADKEGGDPNGFSVNPINGVNPVADNQPVFDQVNFTVPFNAGGGQPQNTYTLVGRVDYNLGEKTQMFFRLGRERDDFFKGTAFYSAYPQYDAGTLNQNQSYLLSVNHTFNANLLNNTKLSFTRFNTITAYNQSLTFTPSLMFVTAVDPVSSQLIQLPGLENVGSPGLGGLPFGGPQNTIQFEHDLSWTKGRHNMKFGGQFTYLQLNVGYGAYIQAVEQLGGNGQDSMDDLVNFAGNPLGSQLGGNAGFTARVDPQGVLPCHTDADGNIIPTADCAVTPPLTSPSPARSYRYNDWAIYGQDSFRLTSRLTLNYGLRWEHYGVQHNNHSNLDSNFYFGSGANLEEQVRNGNVQIADQSSIGQFWQPSWGTFAPRVGFAYDLFGDGKSSLRGGFGISYERNFGNVTFNASFNPPNSAVLSTTCGARDQNCPTAVTNSDLGPLGAPGPTQYLPPADLRMPDPTIHTAQTQFWSASLQREVTRNTVVELGYSGAHGVHLYDINNISNLGFGQLYLGDPAVESPTCNPSHVSLSGVCLTRANDQYGSINMRGSGGTSSYNSFNVRFQTQNLHNTGLSLVANYTWSHALDDISSTFSDSIQGGSGTGYGSLGYTDAFNPKLDWGNADSDVRHRFVVSPIWNTPWFKSGRGFEGRALGGWSLVGILTARSGIPFTVYDVNNEQFFYTIPRLTPATKPDFRVSSNPQATGPNVYNLLSVPVPASFDPLNPVLGISDYGPFPAGMTARNAFRGPGAWNADAAVEKNFKISERIGMEFRAEGFNVFNHHNMYTQTTFLIYGGGITDQPLEVTGFKGGLNTFALGGNNDERRFGQFSLRFTF